MKLTNADVFQAREPMQKLLNEKLPVKVAYGLAKTAHRLSEQFQIIESVRNGLIKKYGTEQKDGRFKVEENSPAYEKFVDEFNELLEQEVELVIDKIKLPETLVIEPKILMALERFVDA